MLFHTVYSALVAQPEISLSNYRTCDTQLIKLKADSLEQESPNNGPRAKSASEAILLIKK